LNDKADLWMVPLIAGLQLSPKFGRFQPFLGAGVDGTYLHVTVDSPYMIPSEGKWGLGSIYTAGALIHLTNSFFIDIFGTYSLIKVYFHDTDHGKVVPQAANISGYSVG